MLVISELGRWRRADHSVLVSQTILLNTFQASEKSCLKNQGGQLRMTPEVNHMCVRACTHTHTHTCIYMCMHTYAHPRIL